MVDRHSPAANRKASANNPPVSVVVVTQDASFYTRIREIVLPWRWAVRQETELPVAHPLSPKSDSILLIVYDSESTGGDWRDALDRSRSGEADACVLLVSRTRDPYLWQDVVKHGGYDVISKSADQDQLIRALRFAWFWTKNLPRQSGGGATRKQGA